MSLHKIKNYKLNDEKRIKNESEEKIIELEK